MAVNFAIVMFFSGFITGLSDEIQWGDVAGDGSVETRTLDVPVVMARGTDNFFEQDPMQAQDWAHTSVVTKSVRAHIKLANSAKPGGTIERFVEALRPIYQAMPKNHANLLSNGTVHYALHRYFTQEKGWSLKGLQPAGEVWMKTMSVTPDVKEVSKFMLPTYLQDLIMKHYSSQGMSLQSLATMAATLEHLIYGEMLNILYSVYSTIGLPTAGSRTDEEIDDIIDMFMMVYAFGFNMEVSTFDDMKKARQHLNTKHSVWPHMRSLAESLKKKVVSSRGSDAMNFEGVMQIAKDFTEQYAQFHSRDCKRAQEKLMAMPSQKDGNVALEDVRESHEHGHRPLFTETLDDWNSLGVLDHASGLNVGAKRLIIPNYIHSQSFCLSTVSFYTVCCPSECEGFLRTLENDVAAPVVEPERLNELVSSRLPNAIGDPTARLADFNSIAAANNGKVPLHSRAFSQWLHRAFPTQCPSPNDMSTTNPKTADEWMQDPDERFKDLEDLMNETATMLAKFTAMGGHMDPEEAPEEEVPQDNEVISLKRERPDVRHSSTPTFSLLSTVFYAIPIVSMLAIASTVVKSGLIATGHGPNDKIKVAQFKDYDHMA
jgi:hypothetical protein